MLRPFGRGWNNKKKTSEKEAQNQRVHNQVIAQTKADLKICIREY